MLRAQVHALAGRRPQLRVKQSDLLYRSHRQPQLRTRNEGHTRASTNHSTDPGGHACAQRRLKAAWQSSIRPRLDAVHRHVLQSRRSAVFLQRLDQLYMHLTNVLAVAQHAEQLHGTNSISSVLPAARRYHQFMLGSKQLRQRLEHTLCQVLPPAPQQAAAAPLNATQKQPQQQQAVEAAALLDMSQACAVLLQRLDPHSRLGAQDSPGSMAWLAALETDHPARQQLQQAQQQERQLLMLLDQLLAGSQGTLLVSPSLLSPTTSSNSSTMGYPFEEPSLGIQSNDSSDSNIEFDFEEVVSQQHPDAGWQAPPEAAPGRPPPPAASSSAGLYSSRGSAASDSSTPLTTSAAAAAAAAGASPGTEAVAGSKSRSSPRVLPVTRSRAAVAGLLRHTRDTLLQQQLYAQGLCPLAAAAADLLARVYRCRQQQASLLGETSLAALLSQQQLCGEPTAVADFLVDLAAALGPAADAEVQSVLLSHRQPPGQEQQQQQLLLPVQDSSPVPHPPLAAAEGGPVEPAPDPWAWEQHYAQYLNTAAPEPAAPDLEAYTTLAGVMAGWSGVLQQLAGVVLVPLALGGCTDSNTTANNNMPTTSSGSSSSRLTSNESGDAPDDPGLWALDAWLGAPGVPWAPHVSAYSVLDVSTGPGGPCHLLGTVFLDWGGAYGCRVLQHSVAEQEEQPADAAVGSEALSSHHSSSSSYGDGRQTTKGRRLSQQLSQQVLGMTCTPAAAATAADAAAAAAIQQLQECSWGLPAVSIGLSAMPRPLKHGRYLSQQVQQQQGQVQVQQQQQQQGPEGVDRAQVEAADPSAMDKGGSCHGAAGGVLSCRLLWELGHELGHALHLVMSGRQPYSVLSGRHLAKDLLELPSQVMERLLLSHHLLSLVCRHYVTGATLPTGMALAVSRYFGLRYNSPLAVQDRTCSALAEQLLRMYSEESDQEDFWAGAFQEWSAVAAKGGVAATGRQLALLPVVAHHQGTYWSYLHCWVLAAQLWHNSLQHAVAELASQVGHPPHTPVVPYHQELQQQQQQHPKDPQPLRQVLLLHAGMPREQLLQQLVSWGSPLAASLVGEGAAAQQLQQSVRQGVSSWLTQV